MLKSAPLCPVASALTLLLLASNAWSQKEPVTASLEWQDAPDGYNCITREQLREEVEKRLRRPVFSEGAARDVQVKGGIRKTSGGFQVELQLLSAHGQPMGERQLESAGSDCSSLDDSLALVLAVMLDISQEQLPAAPPSSGRQETSPSRPEHPAARPLQSKLHVPKGTPPRRPQWHLELGLAATLSLGLLPKPSLGARAHLALEPPEFWKFGVDFGLHQSVDQRLDGVAAGASFSPLEVGIFVCPLAFCSSRLRVEACLAQHLGRLTVEGYGFDRNRREQRSYLNAGAQARASALLYGPLALLLGLGLEAPLMRENFRYGSENGAKPRLFRMTPAVATGQIGVGAQFW